MRFIKKDIRSGNWFVAATMIWTYVVLAIPALRGLNFEDPLTRITFILAGASPSVFGLFFVFLTVDRTYIRMFLKRIVTLGNTKMEKIIIALVLVPLVTVFSAYLSFLFTSVPPDFSVLGAYTKNIGGLFLFAIFTLVFGQLAEEIGRRGYLLDCWQEKGIIGYGAGIGLIWMLWHLPMFFITGSYQNSLALQGLIPVLSFALSTISLGVIIGKITKTTGSILLAILFHFTINFTGELIPLSLAGEVINALILTIIAAWIIFSSSSNKETASGNGG
jgi:membrane protease YdiL (CAAX protease family)